MWSSWIFGVSVAGTATTWSAHAISRESLPVRATVAIPAALAAARARTTFGEQPGVRFPAEPVECLPKLGCLLVNEGVGVKAHGPTLQQTRSAPPRCHMHFHALEHNRSWRRTSRQESILPRRIGLWTFAGTSRRERKIREESSCRVTWQAFSAGASSTEGAADAVQRRGRRQSPCRSPCRVGPVDRYGPRSDRQGAIAGAASTWPGRWRDRRLAVLRALRGSRPR